ncbi:hypothetical protein FM020_14555 [Acinetobacter tandoii]|uniref:hypothetical protein n=1 Tax=Acinetobacter kanungonis TaxID=2699469 RepID=UPI0011586785|nr:hypothetical protein [Acinetobacter kanungonis]NCI78257.1 hypothetical protein [Acinetobacter kanungonis]QDK99038.1 hypothetical protein FM020_14555 [Acinetobacter tandoii]
MPRIFLILGLATAAVFGGLFYQYHVQQQESAQLEQYQKVLYEKTDLIYAQAKDWNTPIEVDVSDPRLHGDYEVMANFVLSQMIQSAEARNAYLRELKAIHWDDFLNIQRLSKDKKQDYQETDLMLQQAHALATEYQVKIEQAQQNALEQAKQLPIQSRYRQQLAENLRESAKQNEALALFEIEKQVLEKADQIFLVLKNNRWENKNNTFMFYDDKALKQFNTLYQEVVKLNSQMQQIQQQNRTALQEKHD